MVISVGLFLEYVTCEEGMYPHFIWRGNLDLFGVATLTADLSVIVAANIVIMPRNLGLYLRLVL